MEGIARFWAKRVQKYASLWQSGNAQRCTLSINKFTYLLTYLLLYCLHTDRRGGGGG